MSAKLHGPRVAAGALALIWLMGEFDLNGLIPWAAEQVADRTDPPKGIFAAVAQRFRSAADCEWGSMLRQALGRPRRWDCTHPTPAERLAALGVSPKEALAAARELAAEGSDPASFIDVWDEIERSFTERVIARLAMQAGG